MGKHSAADPQTCTDQELGPSFRNAATGFCEASVTFAPTEATMYSGSRLINDHLEPGFGRTIRLMGTGKAPK
jgi:hypothetical protein